MARRYTEREDEVVYALLCDGLGLTAIHRKLAANEAGLGYPREIPVSSLKVIRKRMIKAHGDPRPIVAVEDESKAVSSARRRLVTIITSEVKRLSDLYAVSGVLEREERSAVVQLEGKLAEIENRRKPAPKSKQGDAVKAGHDTREADDPRSLAAIAARAAQSQEPAPNGHLSEAVTT